MTRSTNTSGYTGVSWNAKMRKWTAKLTVNKKVVLEDYFDDKEAAARANSNLLAS